MKRKNNFLILICALLCGGLASCGGTADDAAEMAFEAYYQKVSDDEIVVENQACFVDSQILLTATEGVSQSQIEKLVKKKGGSIVGYISISNDYQIIFSEGKTYEELDAIISEWSNNDNVEAVSLNYAIQIDTDSIDYTKDPWIDADNASNTSGSEWSETAPEGNNWWAEAIMMPSVWNMDTEFQPVKVGIYDTMFDTDNEDLSDVFIKIWNSPEDEDGNCMVSTLYSSAKQANQVTTNYHHGTHVAGLIAAQAENGFGIAGVSQNAELYGFSFESAPTDTEDVSNWDDLFEIKYSIALMLNEGVKVINFSIGDGEMLVAAQHGVEKALTTLKKWSTSYEQFFKKCLGAGYDFLIVKCSGNENGYNWVACEVTESNPYGYTKDSTAADDTVYDVQYDFLGAIEDETVKAHILIVGAAENQINYYTTAYFSTVGKRVDVYAPGVDILSDFPTNITAMDTGTSMAAPIVSGIAALVWGANPDLSAVQVASIIRASASVSMFDSESVSNIFKVVETTPIVNAYFAVQLALNTSGEENSAANTVGIITGMVYTTGYDDSLTALSDVSVTVMDSEGKTVESTVTTGLSGYTFILPADTYTITVEMKGYEEVSKEVSLANSDVLNVDFELNSEMKTEEELHAIFSDTVSQDQEIYFFYDDFDNNGENEAFGITGYYNEADGLYNDVFIYYISSDGSCGCVNDHEDLYGYLTIGSLLSVNNHKFLLWERSAGGSGSATIIYGVKDGTVYEPEISGEYMCFGTSQDYMGIIDSTQPENSYVGFSSDFSKGYHDYIPVYFVFDENAAEFTLYHTQDETEINVKELISSGTCGDNLTWTLTEDGTLTISGTGEMTGWLNYRDVPWRTQKSMICAVVVKEGVTSIGADAFYKCTNLTSVVIPDSVTVIGDYAFYYCLNLYDITMSKNVVTIGNYAFFWCNNLTDIIIPNSVISIGACAFNGSNLVATTIVPSSVVSIGSGAFTGTPWLEAWLKRQGEFAVLTGILIKYQGNKEDATIPNEVTAICTGAFSGRENLTSVTIPASVTSIESYAFYECANLTDIYYAGSKDAWNTIDFGDGVWWSTTPTIHYNSTGSPA